MKSAFSFIRDGGWLMMTLSVVAGVLFVTMAVNAATTISTNIATDGTLLVNNATSTITNLSMITSTSTSATSTSLFATRFVSTDATTTSLYSSGTSLLTRLVVTDATTTSLSVGGRAAIGTIFSVAATSSLATTTVSRLGVGTTTPLNWSSVGEVMIDGPATTTLMLSNSGAATVGTCIQMKSVAGANTRIYVNVAGTGLTVEAGTCR